MGAGKYDRRVKVTYFGILGTDQAGQSVGGWITFKVIWANVRDELPSRNETVILNLPVARNLTRVRYRYNEGITTDMRMELLGRSDKGIMQIIGGPSEVADEGRERELEVMCETIK
jgi:head-tail adaptor